MIGKDKNDLGQYELEWDLFSFIDHRHQKKFNLSKCERTTENLLEFTPHQRTEPYPTTPRPRFGIRSFYTFFIAQSRKKGRINVHKFWEHNSDDVLASYLNAARISLNLDYWWILAEPNFIATVCKSLGKTNQLQYVIPTLYQWYSKGLFMDLGTSVILPKQRKPPLPRNARQRVKRP
jgi:hypothetical protein